VSGFFTGEKDLQTIGLPRGRGGLGQEKKRQEEKGLTTGGRGKTLIPPLGTVKGGRHIGCRNKESLRRGELRVGEAQGTRGREELREICLGSMRQRRKRHRMTRSKDGPPDLGTSNRGGGDGIASQRSTCRGYVQTSFQNGEVAAPTVKEELKKFTRRGKVFENQGEGIVRQTETQILKKVGIPQKNPLRHFRRPRDDRRSKTYKKKTNASTLEKRRMAELMAPNQTGETKSQEGKSGLNPEEEFCCERRGRGHFDYDEGKWGKRT